MVSCGLDPLRDEHLMLCEALRAAGVTLTHIDCPHAPHGFLGLPGFARDAKECKAVFDRLADVIMKRL